MPDTNDLHAAPADPWADAARSMLSTWETWFGGGDRGLQDGATRLLAAACFAWQAADDAYVEDGPRELMCAFLRGIINPMDPALDQLRACNRPKTEPTATGDDARGQALEEAAKWVDQRLADYVSDHGVYDPETGATEFPGNGEEYCGELEEISEGIRALALRPPTRGGT